MICKSCAQEADTVKAGGATHNDFELWAEDWQDWGAERSPFGHAACTGACDCQHKPVGSHEGNPHD